MRMIKLTDIENLTGCDRLRDDILGLLRSEKLRAYEGKITGD